MDIPLANTLPKEERLCGKTNVSALIAGGKWNSTTHFRFCWRKGKEGTPNRIMVSVPKKLFKRAVKRNLLKRRIREAYRTRKSILEATGVDILFQYNHDELLSFADICTEIEAILNRIAK